MKDEGLIFQKQKLTSALKKVRAVYVPFYVAHLLRESLHRRRYTKTFSNSPHSNYLEELQTQGVTVLGQLFSSEQCAQWAQQLRQLINDNSAHLKTYDNEMDRRFYGINELTSNFDDFVTHKQIREIRDTYMGPLKSGFLLGAHIQGGNGNRGSGGGWHRDSTIHAQLKVILYLTDTDSTNGPFQYLRASHRNYSTLWDATKIDKRYRQFRYDSQDYAELFEGDPRLLEFCAPAGTVILADTSGIHRGKPLIADERLALTHYLFHENQTTPKYSKLPRPSRLPEFAANRGRGFESPLNDITT